MIFGCKKQAHVKKIAIDMQKACKLQTNNTKLFQKFHTNSCFFPI